MGNMPSEETRGAQQLATNSTDMGILLKVRGITGEMKTIDLCDTEEQLRSITVLQLKEKIIEKFGYQWQPSGAPVSCVFPDLRLIYSGRKLEEPNLLSQCGISHMSTIFVVRRRPVGGSLPAETRGAQQLATNSTYMRIQLKVRGRRGEEIIIDLCDTEEQLRSITVLQLKEKIIEKFGYQWRPSDLPLIYRDKALEEPDLLSQYGIRHMSRIHVLLKLSGGGRGPPPVTGDGGMGDKDGKNRSMETIRFF